jgi:hypothetical protein
MNIINHQSDFWRSHKLKFGGLGKHYCESHPKEKTLYSDISIRRLKKEKRAVQSLKIGLVLVIALRPQTLKDIRGGWSHYTDTSEPVEFKEKVHQHKW